MPVPKRRTSKAKRASRAAQWKGNAPTFALCPQCRQPKLPHRACPNCGYYGGRQVLEVE